MAGNFVALPMVNSPGGNDRPIPSGTSLRESMKLTYPWVERFKEDALEKLYLRHLNWVLVGNAAALGFAIKCHLLR